MYKITVCEDNRKIYINIYIYIVQGNTIVTKIRQVSTLLRREDIFTLKYYIRCRNRRFCRYTYMTYWTETGWLRAMWGVKIVDKSAGSPSLRERVLSVYVYVYYYYYYHQHTCERRSFKTTHRVSRRKTDNKVRACITRAARWADMRNNSYVARELLFAGNIALGVTARIMGKPCGPITPRISTRCV